MTEKIACAHLKVVRRDPAKDNWFCDNCEMEFNPGRTIDRIAQHFFPEQKTLRDELAIAALTGLLADPNVHASHKTTELAYEMADNMLKARKK